MVWKYIEIMFDLYIFYRETESRIVPTMEMIRKEFRTIDALSSVDNTCDAR